MENIARNCKDLTSEWTTVVSLLLCEALESGQADGMIAGMTVTDERKKSYDFSDSYFDSGIQLAVKKEILRSSLMKI